MRANSVRLVFLHPAVENRLVVVEDESVELLAQVGGGAESADRRRRALLPLPQPDRVEVRVADQVNGAFFWGCHRIASNPIVRKIPKTTGSRAYLMNVRVHENTPNPQPPSREGGKSRDLEILPLVRGKISKVFLSPHRFWDTGVIYKSGPMPRPAHEPENPTTFNRLATCRQHHPADQRQVHQGAQAEGRLDHGQHHQPDHRGQSQAQGQHPTAAEGEQPGRRQPGRPAPPPTARSPAAR